MKHNLIIETGQHFLPPARSPCLLVSDKDFSNFWIMASWQICRMRLNRMADARLPNVNPLAAQPPQPPITLCGCLRCQITQHLLAQGTAGRQDCMCTTYTVSSQFPHPLFKDTHSLLPCDLLLYAHPLVFRYHPTPNSFSLSHSKSVISHKYLRNGAGNREKISAAPPWGKHSFWMLLVSFAVRVSGCCPDPKKGAYKPFSDVLNHHGPQSTTWVIA